MLVNNVLILEIDNKGILISKKLLTKNEMNRLTFDKNITDVDLTKDNFVYKFLYSLRQKINDPLGKKRIKN